MTGRLAALAVVSLAGGVLVAARPLPTPAPAGQPPQAQPTQAPAGTAEKTQLTFQDGVNGYASTIDVEIWAVSTNTCLEGNPNASSDADNDGGESQILLRFDDIIGDKPGQIPPKSAIHSAKMIVSAFDPGDTVHLHRMLVPWKRTATWANMVEGVTADGLEASKQKDSFTFGKIAASSSEIVFEVTDTVQAWAAGKPNYGWVFINTGANGWDFYTSEFEDVKQRPKLIVEYTPPKK
ncbi:MAG: DNRLRE domain-containing protein [Gemmataceae bacterium]|nr:DNRLRE domain-containing protein [Gemmataceae bacterium]